jgi:hypothetical protein
MNITKSEIEKVFTEWERLYRENPDDFCDKEDLELEEFGKQSATEFLHLLKEIREKNKK